MYAVFTIDVKNTMVTYPQGHTLSGRVLINLEGFDDYDVRITVPEKKGFMTVTMPEETADSFESRLTEDLMTFVRTTITPSFGQRTLTEG